MNTVNTQLEALINRARAEREQEYCFDELDICNLCAKPLAAETFVIDGEVKGTPQLTIPGGATVGEWAYMCAACFSNHGVGVAWGRGQLYERSPDGKWLMVAGFAPETDDDA